MNLKQSLILLPLGVSTLACAPQTPNLLSGAGTPASSSQTKAGSVSAAPPPAVAVHAYEREAERAKEHEDRARALLESGDPESAEDEALQALSIHPRFSKAGDPWILQLLAEIRIAQNRPKEARDLLLATFDQGGAMATDVRLETALASAMMGDLQGAARYADESDMVRFVGRQSVGRLPRPGTLAGMKARLLFALGMFHQGRSDDERAAPYLQAAATAAPANPEIAFHAARSMMRVGKHAHALSLFRTAARGGGHAEDVESAISSLERERKLQPRFFAAEQDMRRSKPARRRKP